MDIVLFIYTSNINLRVQWKSVNVCTISSEYMLLASTTKTIDILHRMCELLTGQMVFKNQDMLASMLTQCLVPVQYADDAGLPTTQYPLNPNGSPAGIAGLCSADGRHLAMMPHPERCVMMWQWPWTPASWQPTGSMVSPWLCMFKNAFDWCLSHNRWREH